MAKASPSERTDADVDFFRNFAPKDRSHMKCPNCKEQATSFSKFMKIYSSDEEVVCQNCNERLQAFSRKWRIFLAVMAGVFGVSLGDVFNVYLFEQLWANMAVELFFILLLYFGFVWLYWRMGKHKPAGI